MNWFTHSYDKERMRQLHERGLADACEHVEADFSKAHIMTGEEDSFGPVGRYIVCKECHEKDLDELNWEPCRDCGEQKPRREMREWRWYDFYAPQGDEPVHICSDCWGKETHQDRIRRDKEEEAEELRSLRGRGWDDDGGSEQWDFYDEEGA